MVELGVMREGFKEVYNADVKRPEELLERARFSNEFYASKGFTLALQTYIERSSSKRVTALHYGLAHKINHKRSKNYGNKRH